MLRCMKWQKVRSESPIEVSSLELRCPHPKPHHMVHHVFSGLRLNGDRFSLILLSVVVQQSRLGHDHILIWIS